MVASTATEPLLYLDSPRADDNGRERPLRETSGAALRFGERKMPYPKGTPIRAMDIAHGFAARTASVYVITANGLSCKIGRAKNVGTRALNLQIGSVDELYVYGAIRLRERDAHWLERAAHAELRGDRRHIRGEWFCIDPAAAVALLKRLATAKKVEWAPDLQFGFARE